MDNDRPIEKTLRAFAGKRRDDAGAPLEPHPATRRMLHGEIARQFPRPVAGGARLTQLLASWRPQLVWAVPVLVVLCVGVWTLFQTGKKSDGPIELAKNNPAPATQAPEYLKSLEGPPQPATVPATPERLDQPTLAYADTDAKKADDGTLGLGAGTLTLNENRASNVTRNGVSLEKDARLNDAFAPGVPESLSGVARARNLPAPAGETSPGAGIPPVVIAGAQLQAGSEPAAPPTANTELPVPGSSGGGGFGGGGRGGRGGGASAPALASRSPRVAEPVAMAVNVPPPAKQVDRVASYGLFSNQAQAVSQASVPAGANGQFRNTAKPAVPNQILAAFQVEQSGNQLRVIDNDGSTYTGGIEMAADEKDSSAATAQTGTALPKSEGALVADNIAAAPASSARNAQNFSFRVAGTNRTLNQQVVFTGNFLEITNLLVAAQAGLNLDQARKARAVQAQQSLPLLQNSVINGRAQIGAGRQIEINAVPAAP